MNLIHEDLNQLTSTIVDARQKPHLKPTVKTALEQFGHEPREITEALDAFFEERTLQ